MQLSHVVPSFVIKWIKDTSATGFLRFGDNPNLRAQDGYKAYWLCRGCEEKLNTFETPFATKVFHPLNADGAQRITYGDWLLKLCVSVSWRVLLIPSENGGLSDYSEAQLISINTASQVWKNFLLGGIPHPGKFEQHFLPLDAIESASSGLLPANINRYILRSVNLDVVRGGSTVFTFAKLSKFIILGFIQLQRPRHWEGTKVHVREGCIGVGNYTVPRQFGDYLVDQAQKYAASYNTISTSQREKIDLSMRKNIDRTARSASFQAMDYDVRVFGTRAFDIHRGDTPRHEGEADTD